MAYPQTANTVMSEYSVTT